MKGRVVTVEAVCRGVMWIACTAGEIVVEHEGFDALLLGFFGFELRAVRFGEGGVGRKVDGARLRMLAVLEV